MSTGMEPGQAEIDDIAYWLLLSKELLVRRWVLFVLLSVFHIGISLLTMNMGVMTIPLGIIITQLFLMLLIVSAKASDHCVGFPIIYFLRQFVQQILSVILIAVAGTALIFLALFVGGFVVEFLPAVDYSGSQVYRSMDWLLPSVMRFFFLYSLVTLSLSWFLFPLLVFHKLSLLESIRLSRLAFQRNETVILIVSYVPMLLLVVLLLVTEMSLLVCTVFFPLYAIFLYVSYRHIFLQQKSNRLVPVKAVTAELSP